MNFFLHLKEHYEPPMQTVQMKRKYRHSDCDQDENIMIDHRHEVVSSLPEKLIESLEDNEEHIKTEVDIQRETLPEIDEFNEFSEPEDMMEDLRKEVEKVVETIEDNECMPESTWSYQVPEDDIEEQNQQGGEMLYEKIIIVSTANSTHSNYDDNDNADTSSVHEQNNDTRNFDSEDEEDDQPLEQVRQSLQNSSRNEHTAKKFHAEDDKEDLELTECLKKIHNFKCHICEKAFNSRTALGYHLKTHNTDRRFVCDQVRFCFSSNFLNLMMSFAFSVVKSS
jgi:hypothetical protein